MPTEFMAISMVEALLSKMEGYCASQIFFFLGGTWKFITMFMKSSHFEHAALCPFTHPVILDSF
jgi:hypothetical protein